MDKNRNRKIKRKENKMTKTETYDDYDAGLLSSYGGGDVGWWQDYIRAIIGQANDHWRTQFEKRLKESKGRIE